MLRGRDNDDQDFFQDADAQRYRTEFDIDEQTQVRFSRFEKWVERNDFDVFMYKIVLMHDNDWREKCWCNGSEVLPNNILKFVINYVESKIAPTKTIGIVDEKKSITRFFKGYYFNFISEEKKRVEIFNADDFKKVLTVCF